MNISRIKFPGLERLEEAYREIDEQILLFKHAARIECLKKCRECCHSARFVEASLFEMLPLSIRLWEIGKAESILEKLEETDPEGTCILLNRDPSLLSEGGCTYYSFRPFICRLFGFSAVADKHGNPRMALCKPLKNLNPGIEDRLNEGIRGGLSVPLIPDLSRQVSLLSLNFGLPRYSINSALRQALEVVGQRIRYLSASIRK